jgi:hypothetical protein
MPAEIALVGFGVLADTTGTRIEKLPAKQVREAFQTWPRHGFKYAFPHLVALAALEESVSRFETYMCGKIPSSRSASEGRDCHRRHPGGGHGEMQ